MQLETAKILQPLSKFKFNTKIKFKLYDADHLQTYFSFFRLHSYLLLLFSPIGLGASGYLLTASFKAASISIGLGPFSLGLLLLLPWTLVPILFLFTSFRSKTWQKVLSWVYVGVLIASFSYWLYYFS